MAWIEACRHELEVTVPLLEVANVTEEVLSKVQKKASLPGFRPGKAPLSIIKNRFRDEIRQEVLDVVIPRFLGAKFEEEKLSVVGTPSIIELKFNDGEPIVFKARFEVHPEFDVKDYKGIEVEYEDPIVTDEDVNSSLEQLRESKAEYVNIDPRPAQIDDYVVVGLESVEGVEGEPMKNPEMMIKLGDPDTIQAFSEGLVGLAPGESKFIDVTYPDDYGQERLAGKTVKFDVELKFIRSKEVPELNDEFAESMGDFRTVDELRDQVRANLFGQRQFRAQEEAKGQLLDKLADLHDFAVPDAYVDRQLEGMLRNYAESLASQGIDPSKLNFDFEKFKTAQRDRAVRDVKATLLVDRIAGIESITPSQEEVDKEVARIARQQREAVAIVRAKLEKDGTLDRIASNIRSAKAISHIFESVRKVTPAPKPAPVEAEPAQSE